MINVLREKADDMQEQMDTVNRETEILRKNKKDVPEIGNTDGNEERPGRVCQWAGEAEDRTVGPEHRAPGPDEIKKQSEKSV